MRHVVISAQVDGFFVLTSRWLSIDYIITECANPQK